MPVGTGLLSQLGWGLEVTPGTAVVATAWADGLRSESLKIEQEWMISQALRAGRRTQRTRVAGTRKISGNVEVEVSSGSIGMLLRQSVGAEAISGIGPYNHTFTPTTAVEVPSTTVEVGRPSLDGTVRRFRYVGAKVDQWELSQDVDEFLIMSVDYMGMTEDLTGAMSTPTYTTVQPFTFVNATLTLGGSAECFSSLKISGKNNISSTNLVCATDPRAPKVRDPGFHELGGSFEQEFEDMTLYNLFVAGTPATFGAIWSAGSTSILEIAGQVMYDGETPNVTGPDVLMQSVPFSFIHATADASAFTATLTNSVATVS